MQAPALPLGYATESAPLCQNPSSLVKIRQFQRDNFHSPTEKPRPSPQSSSRFMGSLLTCPPPWRGNRPRGLDLALSTGGADPGEEPAAGSDLSVF